MRGQRNRYKYFFFIAIAFVLRLLSSSLVESEIRSARNNSRILNKI